MQSGDTEVSATKPPRWYTRLPGFPHWVAWLFYFFIAYVLSLGLITKELCPQSKYLGLALEEPAIKLYFTPALLLCNNSDLCETALDWYLEQVWRCPP